MQYKFYTIETVAPIARQAGGLSPQILSTAIDTYCIL